MRYNTIADIFSANERFRQKFLDTVAGITPTEGEVFPEGEKWSIKQIIEHVSMVEFGVSRICSRLLDAAKADGRPSDGSFSLTVNFGENAAKIATQNLEAPERVQPGGSVAISESLERLAESTRSIQALRPDLEIFDLTGHTFPHPYFGELTAPEWLVVAGLHERRHTNQIARFLAAIRK